MSKCGKNRLLVVLGRVEVPDIAYGWCISHTVHARWFGGTSYCGLTTYNDFSMIICTLGRARPRAGPSSAEARPSSGEARPSSAEPSAELGRTLTEV